MKIKSVSIKNYRGIRMLENIHLTSLTAIIGKNDAGKSAILHAINSFYNVNKLIDEDEEDIEMTKRDAYEQIQALLQLF